MPLIELNARQRSPLLLGERSLHAQRHQIDVTGYRIEWSAQFVTHYCQKLGFGLVRLCRPAPLRDARTQNKNGRRGNPHESLKGNQALMKRGPDERTVSQGGAPYRYHGHHERGRYRASLAEPNRCPDEKRKKQIG